MTDDHHPDPTGDHEGAIVDGTLPRPRVVALGAYERDNFGDLLYREIMRDLFEPTMDAEFAAPFASPGGDGVAPVAAAGPLLMAGELDAIWTVGGEVGATDLTYAYMTSYGSSPELSLDGLDPAEQQAAIRARTGGVLFDAPYFPRPSALPSTRDAQLILNSVGLAGIPHQPAWRRAQLAAALNEADFISVRDPRSSAFLDRVGKAHRLAPDLVHSLAHTRPAASSTGHALVHLSDYQFAAHSVDIWASAIAASSTLRGMPVRLFVAGTAPGHDSVSAVESLRQRLLQIRADWDVTVSSARGVWPRVDEISASALWIGSSLHGRIVAQAYGVPRASFTKGKVDVYADHWDPDMPARVTPATLDEAAVRALEAPARPADHLADQALQSVSDALAVVGRKGRRPDLFEVRVAEAEALSTIAKAHQQELNDARAELVRLRGRVTTLSAAPSTRDRIGRIRSSTSRRLADAIARIARRLRLH